VAPDLTPFLLTTGGIGAVGLLLGWLAVRRRRSV